MSDDHDARHIDGHAEAVPARVPDAKVDGTGVEGDVISDATPPQGGTG